jgi:hypothetical protein
MMKLFRYPTVRATWTLVLLGVAIAAMAAQIAHS